MKLVSRIATFILIAFLFAQSVLVVEAKGENKKPDPQFKDKATHVENSKIPYYDSNATVDLYLADGLFYSVDVGTEDIVDIEPEEMYYQIDATYNEDQLREIAETMIADFTGDKVELDKLSYSLEQKIGTYFFRWEDIDKKLDNKGYSFIQVGLSQNGDFLNYVNTLSYGKKIASALAPKAYLRPAKKPQSIGPFNQIYANGGSYWTSTSTSLFASTTGGYYSSNSGCSGAFCTKYYYTSARSTAYLWGKWSPATNTKTRAAAYIPYGSNATAKVQYDILLRSSSTYIYKIVDQNAYGNTWVLLTSSTIANGIAHVRLYDIGLSGTGSLYKVAWDELWVYNP
jgi:hypothetical protein